jgi:squalene-hopene/tetraprenyl-beta-curcumene cyclase
MSWVGRSARLAAVVAGVLVLMIALDGCRKRTAPVDVAAARQKAEASGKKSREWLRTTQLDDGTFTTNTQVKVGLTALAAIALLDQDLDEKDPNVQRAIAFVAAQQKEDGSIRLAEGIENYETALSAIALDRTRNAKYNEMLHKAQQYMVSLQKDETEGIATSDTQYGGIGYGRRGGPDLSNTQFGLEALRATELGADDAAFKRARIFLERCQNLQKVNNQPWASNDGGFVYMPGLSLANNDAKGNEPRHSYGSMTYAGLLSFSYCNVPKDDPRVKAALAWLGKHWTLDENPGMGKKALYYYYMVMAKALSAQGEKYFVDDKGVRHHWAAELVNKLAELQHPEGYWVNTDVNFMENNKSLVTAYCMIALGRCKPFLNE